MFISLSVEKLMPHINDLMSRSVNNKFDSSQKTLFAYLQKKKKKLNKITFLKKYCISDRFGKQRTLLLHIKRFVKIFSVPAKAESREVFAKS